MAEYFSHDYNAQHDEKNIKLLQEMGWLGYGLYCAIVERIYNEKGYLSKDYESLAFALHTDIESIKKVIENYQFPPIGGYSPSHVYVSHRPGFSPRFLMIINLFRRLNPAAQIGVAA